MRKDFFQLSTASRVRWLGALVAVVAFAAFDIVYRRKVVTTPQGHTFVLWRHRHPDTLAHPSGCIVYEYSVDSLDSAAAKRNEQELAAILIDDVKTIGLDCVKIVGTGSSNSKKGFIAYGASFESMFYKGADEVWKQPMGSVGNR